MLPVPLPGTELTRRLREQGRIYPTEYVGLEYYDACFPLFRPDEPLTPEDMQRSIRKIMGLFYRPRHMFSVGLDILSFPAIVFQLHQIRAGWGRWYRRWIRNVYRAGGWLLLRRWTAAFKKDAFKAKLSEARRRQMGQGPQGVGG